MPKVPSLFLRNTVFLYPSEDAAKSGKGVGGTGFVVGIPSFIPGRIYCYVVTNWHVACKNGNSVVRVNTKDGGFDTFPFDPAEWIFIPRYDIAIVPINFDDTVHELAVVAADRLLTNELQDSAGIGPGDDVFMVGRFVDHGGKERNQPALRFGHVSMNLSPILQTNGVMADLYCIDLHSRSGFSGSPVFVYRTPGYDLGRQMEEYTFLRAGANFLALLGIHWGQFPERWEVTKDGALRHESEDDSDLLTGKQYIEGLSGMTCVLPAWNIMEVLNMPKLKNVRDAIDSLLYASAGSSIPIAETSEPSAPAPAPDHEAEGDEILRRMLNTPPKPK
jgi:Trypsin-like peptidase domain